MSNHTPGPWYTNRYEGERERPDTWAGWHIQECEGDRAPPDVACVDDADYGPEVAEANANLISAAPDLLKACRRARDFIAAHTASRVRETDLLAFYSELDRVVAKAEGRGK